MNGPRLSVVIPCHRRVDLLSHCLSSLQRFAARDTEIIVVDDGSPGAIVNSVAWNRGATALAVSALTRPSATLSRSTGRGTNCLSTMLDFPPALWRKITVGGVEAHNSPFTQPIRVIRFSQPRGFCSAANAGIKAASARIVQLLNDDAEVTANWAEPALAAFDDAKVVAVAPLVLRWPGTDNPPTIDSAGDEYDRGGFARSRGHDQKLGPEFLRPTLMSAVSGSAGFFRRDAVLAAGGFPESFDAYFEDVDLSCRLRRAGGLIQYVPASRVLHRGSSTHGRGSARLVAQQSCNEERLFWRNQTGTPSEYLRHAAVLVGKVLRRATEGTLAPWLAGRLRAWTMMPRDVRRA